MKYTNTLSVEKAAELLNSTPQTIRMGIKEGRLPIGFAVGTSGKSTRYIIPRALFTQITGIEV